MSHDNIHDVHSELRCTHWWFEKKKKKQNYDLKRERVHAIPNTQSLYLIGQFELKFLN